MWGPYEVRKSIYRKFLIQRDFMMSGRVGYQCIDSIGEAARTGKGCDCIHAMTDMDAQFGRKEYPLRKFGDAGSENIVKELVKRDLFINPAQTHDWLITALGLDRYHINRRCVNIDHAAAQPTLGEPRPTLGAPEPILTAQPPTLSAARPTLGAPLPLLPEPKP